MAVISKQLASRIAKKLRATVRKRSGKAHDLALVYHEGKLIATFGIRRGSRKNLGRDHVPRQLHLRASQARLLGQCPLQREDWIAILAEKGLL